MAYRPSYRSSRYNWESPDPNLTPVMNLMVVIIPLLLTSAQFIKISIIELNLPPSSSTRVEQPVKPTKKQLKLELAITITDKGFFLSSSSAVLKSSGKQPSIPKKNGAYDFGALSQKLYQIKKKVTDRFVDRDAVVIQAEPEIDYQTLISTMDAARSIRLNNRPVVLFPKVSVSATLL